jgi:predicted house-cleaning noncanonical NTP pyrophosphatase (MazG superfamily)
MQSQNNISEDFVIKSTNEIPHSVSQIGQKACGLFKCPSFCVPRFIILTSDLFELWLTKKEDVRQFLDSKEELFSLFFSNKEVIIRSSANIESFEERGYYESSLTKIKIENISSEIENVYQSNKSLVESIPNNDFSIIIQEYINPKLIGHLSNERRLSQSNNNWFYEILDAGDKFVQSARFLISKPEKYSTKPLFLCETRARLEDVLKEIAFTFSKERVHIEWVWDGKKIWIVQKDLENDSLPNTTPGSKWKKRDKQNIKTMIGDLTILKTVETTDNEWIKINCIKTFKDCGLSYGNVYIIEGEDLLREIYNNETIEDLTFELQSILNYPVVIRMDIVSQEKENFLLPRTETLFTIAAVFSFLKKNLLALNEKGVPFNSICFLMHRFISSRSCALAFSKPDIKITRIDSTWGIVDGLYYYPHDSFEYTLFNKKTKEKIRCKTEYLDVDEYGNWITVKTGPNIDWKKSLSKREIIQISETTQKIANFLKRPVTVMYFVGVFPETGYQPLLPWFYTTEEISDTTEKFSEIIFSEKKYLIENKHNFEELKTKVSILKNKNKVTIKLKLVPELLRDKEFIEEIGRFGSEHSLPIEIEGSILSHPYYILRKQNARVKVNNLLDPDYSGGQNFYKLVRDKIPVTINLKGEAVKFHNVLDSTEFLGLLKQKLVEEAFECFWENDNDKLIHELADLYEVIRGVVKLFQKSIDEIIEIADNKKEEKGGFEQGTFLIETRQQSLININYIREKNELFLDIPQNAQNERINFQSTNIPEFQKSFISDGSVLNIPLIPFLQNKKKSTK